MTQNEIIMLNQKSPSECHKLLIKEYGKYVYIIVFNHLRNCGTKEDIEECVSDIFAELFINLESDFYSGDIKSSLGTLAKRRAVNYYHKLMNHNSEYTELTNHLADDMDIVSAFEKKERQHIMMQCTEAVHGLSEHTVRQLVLQNKVKYIRTGQGDSPQCGEMSQSDRGDGRPLGERGKILVNKEDLLRLFEAR